MIYPARIVLGRMSLNTVTRHQVSHRLRIRHLLPGAIHPISKGRFTLYGWAEIENRGNEDMPRAGYDDKELIEYCKKYTPAPEWEMVKGI